MRFIKSILYVFPICFLLSCSAPATGEWSGHTAQENKKVCVVGDTGTGEVEQYRVATAMENYGCGHILITGDLIYPVGLVSMNDKDFKNKFLDPFKSLLKSANFYISLGNHDYYGKQWVWLEIAKHYPQVIFPHYWYRFELSKVCFYSLDTNWLKLEMYKWVKERIAKDKHCVKKVVFGHHPYRSSGEHGDSNFSKKLFMNYGFMGRADLFIAGHDHHLSDEGMVRGTRQLISGAGAKLRGLRKKPVWGVSDYGFVSLDLEKMTYTFINYKGEALHSGEF